MGNNGAKPRPLLLQLGNVAAVAITLVGNILVNTLPLNGVTTAQVSDSYPNLFTPPGYVFAIWGVIYALAIIFALYQLRPSQRIERYLTAIGWLYLYGAVVNVAWLAVFHYSFGVPILFLVSTVLLLLLLWNLTQIYKRVGIGGIDAHRGEKLGVHIPISIYLGWISVASIAGVASAINVLIPGIPIGMQAAGTAMMLLVALGLTLYMLWHRRDLVFALVVVWAVSGIASKQTDPAIHYTALVVLAIGFTAAILMPTLRRMGWVGYYLS